MAGVMLLPLSEIVSRKVFQAGMPGSGPFAQTLTLWVGMLGAAIAAREGKLLTLATGEFLPKGWIAPPRMSSPALPGPRWRRFSHVGGDRPRPKQQGGRRRHRLGRAGLGRRSRAARRVRTDRAAAGLARLADVDRPRYCRAGHLRRHLARHQPSAHRGPVAVAVDRRAAVCRASSACRSSRCSAASRCSRSWSKAAARSCR